MKSLLLSLILLIAFMGDGQTCDELIEYVKENGRGSSYNSSFSSDAISMVTFYDITIDYQQYYFAIVCFKRGYMGCDEYIYQVSSQTKFNYSMHYFNSAGKAFWEYIEPYNSVLGCAPNFE